jgi:hypothetical protein
MPSSHTNKILGHHILPPVDTHQPTSNGKRDNRKIDTQKKYLKHKGTIMYSEPREPETA